MSDWWLSRASGSPEGPFPPSVLIQGLISEQIPTHAYVCRVGDQSWVRINQVDEIWGLFTSTKPKEAPAPANTETAESSSKRQSTPSTASTLLDVDDENEQTRIIAPVATDESRTDVIATKTRVSENGFSARSLATPLPKIPAGQFLHERNQPKTHDVRHPVPQKAVNPVPRGPTLHAVDGARPVPTPLPYLPSPTSRLEAPRTKSEPPPNYPIRAKIPNLEGISEPVTSKLPQVSGNVVGVKPAISASDSMPAVSGSPTAPQNGTEQKSPQVKSRTESTSPSTAFTKGGLHSPQGAPNANVSSPNLPGNVQRGLVGLGLSPLPKAQTTALPLAGLSNLAPFPKPGSTVLTPLPITSIVSNSRESSSDTEETRPLGPRDSVVKGNNPVQPILPPILGAKRVAKSELNSPSQLPSTPSATSVLAADESVLRQSSPLLDESGDVDDVTTVSQSAFLDDDESLENAFDNDVTQLVSADKLPDTERNSLGTISGTHSAPATFITPIPINSSPPPKGHASAPEHNAIAPLRSPTESKHDTHGNHSAKPAPPTRAHKPSLASASVDASRIREENEFNLRKPELTVAPSTRENGDGRTVSEHAEGSEPELSNFDAHINADPSELLEEDTDDSSMPIRMVSSIPPPLTASKEPEKAASLPSVKPRAKVAGPVISVPPKAVHVTPGPSVVLRAEPVVHQEATKPAVRSIRQPGVIQITYGTLIIAILGTALLILVLVLVLK